MKASFFYAYNVLVASIYPGWLQYEFDSLKGLFGQVGIFTNVQKNVGMVCNPFRSAWVQADEAYTRSMTGEGLSFKDRQREQVLYLKCGN